MKFSDLHQRLPLRDFVLERFAFEAEAVRLTRNATWKRVLDHEPRGATREHTEQLDGFSRHLIFIKSPVIADSNDC